MIDREQVHKVAHLARLQLSPEEEEAFTGQLQDILDHIEQLNELDTENVEPTTRAIDMNNVMRPDIQVTSPNREAILNCAPERDGDYFRVPRILSEG
jgi:aspartyl-tRNA(Asn)/glutamyl-tRNA(Gln) amidotransferase subunit C